jgi:tetratricopeptide (TPR) repeat protein
MKTQGRKTTPKPRSGASRASSSSKAPIAVKPVRSKAGPARAAAAAEKDRKPLKPENPPVPAGNDRVQQRENFEKAMKLFHKRDFARAKELFDQAARGPVQEIAHTARMHFNMCERRLQDHALTPRTPEDKYLHAIALINRGEYDQAAVYLKEAIAANESADHFHYALALCSGLKGDAAAAARHLRRAIEISPANRGAARNDSDFETLLKHPEIREVLGSQQ